MRAYSQHSKKVWYVYFLVTDILSWWNRKWDKSPIISMGNINSFHHDKNTFIIIKYTWHALNEHYGNGTDRMTCRVEWYYLNQHLLCVESMFVCECVRCQEWECPFVGRPCLCHAAPIGWTECLQYVIFIMDYCPSWTLHMALGLTMSHEHTFTLYAMARLLAYHSNIAAISIHWLVLKSQFIFR